MAEYWILKRRAPGEPESFAGWKRLYTDEHGDVRAGEPALPVFTTPDMARQFMERAVSRGVYGKRATLRVRRLDLEQLKASAPILPEGILVGLDIDGGPEEEGAGFKNVYVPLAEFLEAEASE